MISLGDESNKFAEKLSCDALVVQCHHKKSFTASCFEKLQSANFKSNVILSILPQERVTSLWDHLRVISPTGNATLSKNLAAVANCWQHCIQFDPLEI